MGVEAINSNGKRINTSFKVLRRNIAKAKFAALFKMILNRKLC